MYDVDVDIILLPPYRGRRKRGNGSERIVTFKASRELVEMLDRLARRKRVTRSELIRRALQMLIAEELKKEGRRGVLL